MVTAVVPDTWFGCTLNPPASNSVINGLGQGQGVGAIVGGQGGWLGQQPDKLKAMASKVAPKAKRKWFSVLIGMEFCERMAQM